MEASMATVQITETTFDSELDMDVVRESIPATPATAVSAPIGGA
jgi:hypothetical protein